VDKHDYAFITMLLLSLLALLLGIASVVLAAVALA
jgi:hypothetical protein